VRQHITQTEVVPGTSASNGAPIVAVLAKILQMPMDVTANKVGKTMPFPMYTMKKRPDRPTFAKSTSIGKTHYPLACQPHTIIRTEKVQAKPLAATIPHFSPRNRKTTPPNKVDTNSAMPTAYPLWNMLPGRYFSSYPIKYEQKLAVVHYKVITTRFTTIAFFFK